MQSAQVPQAEAMVHALSDILLTSTCYLDELLALSSTLFRKEPVGIEPTILAKQKRAAQCTLAVKANPAHQRLDGPGLICFSFFE